MSGWGRVLFSVGFGVLVAAGCGGRTGTLEDDYAGGAENTAAQGGSVSRSGSGPVAGRPTRGGSGSVGGSVGVAGAVTVGGQPGFGGYGGYGGQPPRDCLQCIGQACSAQLITCFQDFGCLSIFDCMQGTGCQAFECYTDQYCRATIDQWGGPNGQAMTELLQTFTCALQAGCQCN
jgi:hypothetical protein